MIASNNHSKNEKNSFSLNIWIWQNILSVTYFIHLQRSSHISDAPPPPKKKVTYHYPGGGRELDTRSNSDTKPPCFQGNRDRYFPKTIVCFLTCLKSQRMIKKNRQGVRGHHEGASCHVLRPIHTEQKRKGEQNFSILFVAYSLIFFGWFGEFFAYLDVNKL